MAILLFLATLVSGTAALVAEVVWFRALGRGVGTSAEALAVVSASFLGGLGIGAAVASRLAPRSLFPFRAAAVCEAAAGVLVFLSPFALKVVPDAHLAVLHALGLEPGPSSWPAALVAAAVLVLPTGFLGATLPFLVKSRLRDVGHAGRWTGRLYAVNTLGAAAGVVVAVFVLMPRFGETMSLRFAAAGNVFAALLILLAERPLFATGIPAATPVPVTAAGSAPLDPAPLLPVAPSTPPPPSAPEGSPLAPPTSPALVSLALFASGAMALGGEVAWFRLLEPIAGVHLYGFALLLASVLIGTAIGGAVGGAVADSSRRPDLALATTIGIGGLLTVLSLVVAGLVPFLAMWTTPREWGWLVGPSDAAQSVFTAKVKVVGAALCVVPPLVAFAAAYPLAVRALARTPSRAAGAAGSVYAWNTAGNVVGSTLAGFVLLPRLGSPATLVLWGGLGLAFACALRLLSARPRSVIPAAIPLLPLLLLALPGPRAALLASGPRLPDVVGMQLLSPKAFEVRSPGDYRALVDVAVGAYPRPALRPDLPPIEPREGVVSNVGILNERETIRLRQGGLSESKFSADDPNAGSETEVFLAILPCLMHPSPRKACVIGHGAGWTCEAMLAGDLDRVDVAEIEPAILDVDEAYRGPLAVRRDPKARLWIADGRLLLRESAARGGDYDLVASQPSHPWVPGAGHLFTVDAYRLARRALAPGGIFAQWLNLFSMTPDLFRVAVASFVAVFPQSWLFLFHDEVVLVGFTSPPKADADRIEDALLRGPLADRARAAGIRDAADLWKRFAVDGAGLARLVGDATPAGDDDARIELGCARLKFAGESPPTKALTDLIVAQFPPDLVSAWPNAAVRDRWSAAVALRLVEDGSLDAAERWTQRVPFSGGSPGLRARAKLLTARAEEDKTSPGDRDRLLRRAEDLLRKAAKDVPSDAEAALALTALLLDQGRGEDAIAAAEAAAARFPGDGRVLAAWARALASHGDLANAAEVFPKALAATSPRAPSATGTQFARLLLSMDPPRKKEALDVFRQDPAVADDALEDWKDLELEAATPTGGRQAEEAVEAKIEARDRARGAERLRTARTHVQDGIQGSTSGLSAAKDATKVLPDSAEAWRLRGWFALRTQAWDEAVSSLSKAISLAPDREAERARAEAWMRLSGRDPAALSAPPEKAGKEK